MQVIQHSQFGNPEMVLQVQNTDIPTPQAGQVRIKTRIASIHHHDLWIVRGEYGIKPQLPATAGSEAVGIVDAVGEGVDSALIGQRVNATGSGTWSEYFITTADRLIKIPDNISDEDAAQVGLMPLSAQVLLNFIGIQSGQWMIQNTANGAVGKALAIFAKRQGISVINLVRRPEAVDELKSLGVEHIINISDSDWQQQVKQITAEPIVAAVDSIGGTHTGELLDVLAENGQLVIFGSLTHEPMTLSSADIIFKRVTIRGFWGATVFQAINETRQMIIQNIMDAIDTGELKLPIEKIYTFNQIETAITATLAKGKNGKVLLKP